MSSKTCTMNDLVDLALQTPEKGAVNFNVLKVVLLKIIEKLDFNEEMVEYKPPDLRTSILKLPEIKISYRSLIKEYSETKLGIETEREPENEEKIKEPASEEEGVAEAKTDSEKTTSSESVDSSLELESHVKASVDDMQPGSTTQDEPEELEEQEVPLQDDIVSSTIPETSSTESEEDSEYEHGTSEEEIDEGQADDKANAGEKEICKPQPEKKEVYSEELEYSTEKDEEDSEKREPSPQKKEEKPSTDEGEKPKALMSSMYHAWQIKKLSVKIDGIEDRINSIALSVEDLKKFKEEREMRRTKFEEGQKPQSEYTSTHISRIEFEDTIDDMGEALSRLFTNQRHQKEECNTINQNISKELSLKASVEDLNRHSEPINSKFRTLGTALTNIQKLIKDVIYPETCGITKCIACGRKSHLPFRCIVMDGKKDTQEYKDAIESIIKISNEKKSEDLKFTNARLRRIDKHQKKKYQGVPQYTEQQVRHLERPLFPDYLIELETLCDASKLSKEFAPLRLFPDLKRRNALYIPSVQPKTNPVSISVIGNDNSQILIKN